MGDRLSKIKEMINRPKNTASGYTEVVSKLTRELKDIIEEYTYGELKTLLDGNKFEHIIYAVIYINKEELKKDELDEIIENILKNRNKTSKVIDSCIISNEQYIELLTMALENKRQEFTDKRTSRVYNMIYKAINKSDKTFKSYDEELNSGYMYITRHMVELISEFEDETKRRNLFKALINREDYIKYLFCYDIELTYGKYRYMTLLDMKNYDEEDTEKYVIYLSYAVRVDISNKELKEIYDKYSYLLFNREKEYYYSNCMIFSDYLNEEEKIEFIDRLVKTDNIGRIKDVVNYNKFRELLDNNVECKNKLDAVLLMDMLSN